MKVLDLARSIGSRFATAHAANPRRVRGAFFAVLAAVVLLTSAKYAAKIAKAGDDGRQTRSAFLRWRDMINGVFAGANIYAGTNEYPNPPVMAILLRPFAALPPTVGALAWFFAKVLLAVLSAMWVFRLIEAQNPTPQPPPPGGEGEEDTDDSFASSARGEPTPPGPPSLKGRGEEDTDDSCSFNEAPEASRGVTPLPFRAGGVGCFSVSPSPPGGGGRGVGSSLRRDLARGAAIALCLPPLLGDLSHNNVNIFILFLVAACLEAFRRRLDTAAGLVLALAVACKVTPLLFVAYFAWKRCWRVLLAALAGLVLWLAVVPGLTFGWDRNRQLLADWYALMIERPLLKGEVTTEHPNQAITGFVYRLFTHSPSYIVYVKTAEGDIPTPGRYHNVLDVGRPAAWVVVKGLTAGFALAVVLLCRWPVRRPADTRGGWRFAAECGLICLGMLLFSERTWKHHAVVLLLPLAALTYAVAVVELPRRVRTFVLGALAATFVLTAGPGLLPARGNDLAMVYGTHTVAFVLLAAAVGSVLACRSDRPDGSGGLRAAPNPG